jgi:hypothetical protein
MKQSKNRRGTMKPGKLKMLVVVCAVAALLVLNSSAVGQASSAQPAVQQVQVDTGIELHYVELGKGEPVVFVHGSLSDGSFWNPQLGPFAEKYHVIAYSRRYNQPNVNKTLPGYSAVDDADDLAGLIEKLQLGRGLLFPGNSNGCSSGRSSDSGA